MESYCLTVVKFLFVVTKYLEIHSADGYTTYWFERRILCDIFYNSTIKNIFYLCLYDPQASNITVEIISSLCKLNLRPQKKKDMDTEVEKWHNALEDGEFLDKDNIRGQSGSGED